MRTPVPTTAQRIRIRLKPPGHTEAWLLGKWDGVDDFARRLLCHIEQPGDELAECARTLWLDGADPRSELTIWWGELPGSGPTPDRALTTTIAAVVPEARRDRRG